MTEHPIIVGGSVAGLSLAGLFAQSNTMLPVNLYAPRPAQSRRLIAGCTLRAPAVALLARAVGSSPDALARRLAGESGQFSRVRFGLAKFRNGRVRFSVPLDIVDAGTRFAGLSSRHGHILETLQEELNKLPNITVHDQKVRNLADLGGFTIDATSAFEGQKALRKLVIAAQAPCRVSASGTQDPLRIGSAYAPIIRFSDGIQLAFFTPFFDPLSPTAKWYGISTKIVDVESNAGDAQQSVKQGLRLMAESLGLEFVDPLETLACATVPIPSDFSFTQSSNQFAAHSAFSSGAPAIAADGMFAMVKGATAYAEAWAAGRETMPAVNRALSQIRFTNRLAQALMSEIPVSLTELLTKICPGLLTSLLNPGWQAL